MGSLLEELRKLGGKEIEIGGNKPLPMRHPDVLWVLEKGQVDVFAFRKSGNTAEIFHDSQRFHLCRLQPGDVLLGIEDVRPDDEHVISFLAVGTIGTKLREIPLHVILTHGPENGGNRLVEEIFEKWIGKIFSEIGKGNILLPKNPRIICGQTAPPLLKKGDEIKTRDRMQWVTKQSGDWILMGRSAWPSLTDNVPFPLHPDTWFVVNTEDNKFSCASTLQLALAGILPDALRAFYRYIAHCIMVEIQENEEKEIERLTYKKKREKEAVKRAFQNLISIFSAGSKRFRPLQNEEFPLLAACQMVATAMNISVFVPPEQLRVEKEPLTVEMIARASGFKTRKVILDGNWWRDDCGPLLIFKEGKPLALIPISPRKYRVCNPETGECEVMTRQTAKEISPEAYNFYRSLPNVPLNAWDLFKFGITRCRRDILIILLMGTLSALLGLLIPLATGLIFDNIIPEASKSKLGQIIAILFTCAFVTTLFEITKGIAIVRLEGQIDVDLQSAVWDRLISLPVPFFRKFSSGDLANRGMGVSAIRQILSGITVNTLLAFIFSSFNLALLFYYDWQLAVVAIVILAFALLFIFSLIYFQLYYERKLMNIEGKLSGLILQFITGIAKLRVSGAERRAFTVWAEKFAEKKEAAFKSGILGNILRSFNAILPVVALITFFIWVIWKREEILSTGGFLAFIAAYTSFQNAALQMAAALLMSLKVVPLYERVKPIIQSLPERKETRDSPGELRGNIDVGHLHFRYFPEGPLVLKDVSIHMASGEFIAIVGESGSGKSTLIRLLLGFEMPESGSIYYDGKDLSTLDIMEVRKQIGVVLQNASLFPDSILKNIVGTSNLTLEDAWEAARMVGIYDDIKEMPMEMNTMVSMGEGTLSGGQRQRLIIARAIVKKPRILFFDEATSALDNETQNIVSESLDMLKVTRIVIAHRLSTIMKADRIYVLQDGEIQQIGTYEELIKDQNGFFYHIAKRQMI